MSADFRWLRRIGKDGGRHSQAGGCNQTEDSFQRHSIHFFLYKGFFAAILGLRGYFGAFLHFLDVKDGADVIESRQVNRSDFGDFAAQDLQGFFAFCQFVFILGPFEEMK